MPLSHYHFIYLFIYFTFLIILNKEPSKQIEPSSINDLSEPVAPA